MKLSRRGHSGEGSLEDVVATGLYTEEEMGSVKG